MSAAATPDGRREPIGVSVDGRALLRLAVRVEDRPGALRALSPVLNAFPAVPHDVSARVAPSLRWLARTRDPGTDLSAWRTWIETWIRREDRRREEEQRINVLDLPSGAHKTLEPERGAGGLDLP